jgi:hypothetical protein
MVSLGVWYAFAALAPIALGALIFGKELLSLGADQEPFTPCTGGRYSV